MNYLAEIIAFERWLENNYLTRDAQLLWYRLMYQANKCNWPEWVTVDNPVSYTHLTLPTTPYV